nr:MAG TPA: hypothetical protein [Caudoviricetes sp.]
MTSFILFIERYQPLAFHRQIHYWYLPQRAHG